MILLGLLGPAGAGKDTVGQHLCERHDFSTYAFADPIRAGLHAMLVATRLLPDSALRDPDKKELKAPGIDRSARELMQTLGTEWGRQMVHPDIWMMAASNTIDTAIETHSNTANARIVFTDVRFRNEAEMIRRRGGLIVNIRGRARFGVNPHVSERDLPLDRVDINLDNRGTLADLSHAVDLLMKRLTAPADIALALRTAEALYARWRAASERLDDVTRHRIEVAHPIPLASGEAPTVGTEGER